jgi:dienelactone hydrolase
LPGGWEGEFYTAAISPADNVSLDGALHARGLPGGLSLDGDLSLVSGLPEATGGHEFSIAGLTGDGIVWHAYAQLPIFANDDSGTSPEIDPAADGPYEVAVEEQYIDEITTSYGIQTSVAVRIAYPVAEEGTEGPFPLIAFHHAAHWPSDIYDRYTALHDHWASHGVVVASVDSSFNVSGRGQSWQNLTNMSTYQLATIDHLLAQSEDESSALKGLVDPTRIIVSGHSRGGGASLISLWREPMLAGAICFEQVSPLQTPSQNWDDPLRNGDRLFPTRPILIFSAADDADEPWPLVDTAYEQTQGPTALVTLHGTNHEYTYDAGTPGGTTSSSEISSDERHELDQYYSTAFIYRFMYADLTHDGALFGETGRSSSLSMPGVSVAGRRYLASSWLIDDFQEDPDENLWGGLHGQASLDDDQTSAPYTEGLIAAGRGEEQTHRIDAWSQARHLSWSSEDASFWTALTPDGSSVDLSAHRWLRFRVASDCPPPSDPCPVRDADFDVELWDASGASASVSIYDGVGDVGIVGRHWTTATLPLENFAVDLTQIQGVELRFDALDEGDLWIDDLRVE